MPRPSIRQHRVIGQFFRLPCPGGGPARPAHFPAAVRNRADRRADTSCRSSAGRTADRRSRSRLAQDRRAHLGLMQPRQTLGQRQVGDRLVARMGLERVARQFQPEHQPDRARGDLGGDRQAAAGSLVDAVERLAPALRRLVVLGDRERDRASGVLRHPQHHRQVFVDGARDRARIAARCGRPRASRRRSRSVHPRRPSGSACSRRSRCGG